MEDAHAPLVRMSPHEADVHESLVSTLISKLVDAEGLKLNSIMVSRGNAVIAEQWWWPARNDLPHMLHSATKSFTGTAAGFAEFEGFLDLDEPVIDILHANAPASPSEHLKNLRVKHLLTMQTGHATGISGVSTRLVSEDLLTKLLSEPLDFQPGTRFAYSSATSHLLSAVVQSKVGVPISEYLRDRLFTPLGISEFSWDRDPSGVSTGGNGLSLTTESFLKFGLLYLHGGEWNGSRVLPPGWVERATHPWVQDAGDDVWDGARFIPKTVPAGVPVEGYGFQLGTRPSTIFYAGGIFGQYCVVIPSLDMVVATTGSIGNWRHRELPALIEEHLLGESAAQDLHFDDQGQEYQALARLSTAAPMAPPDSSLRIMGTASFEFPDNAQHLRSLEVTALPERVSVTFKDHRGTHNIIAGVGTWAEGRTSLTGGAIHHSYEFDQTPYLAAAHWETSTDLAIELLYPETPFRDKLTFSFSSKECHTSRQANVNMGPLTLPTLSGKLTQGHLPMQEWRPGYATTPSI